MKKWKLGDRVVRREGGPMIGTITKIGPNPKKLHTIANITVQWPNGTVGKVSPGQIRDTLPYRLERFRADFEATEAKSKHKCKFKENPRGVFACRCGRAYALGFLGQTMLEPKRRSK